MNEHNLLLACFSRYKGLVVGNEELHFSAVRQYGLYTLDNTFLDQNKEMSANIYIFFFKLKFCKLHNELK